MLSTIKSATSTLLAEQKQNSGSLRPSFDLLLKSLHNQENVSSSLPQNLIQDINSAFRNSLTSSADGDQQYFLKQLSSSPNPWVRLYFLIYEKQWSASIRDIKQSWDNAAQVVPQETLTLLTDELLVHNELDRFLSFYEWTINSLYPARISSLQLQKFTEKCIHIQTNHSQNLLAKFFEKFILYTGPTENIKEEALDMDNQLLESMIDLFRHTGNIKEYSKSVAYYMNRMKAQKGNIRKMNDWRFRSRIVKFDMYVNKLGPYAVLANGMFSNFKLAYNKKIKLEDHMLLFTDSLAEYLAHSEVSISRCILMIELMHGLHVRQYKEAYSKALNPDIQMARVYRSVIKNSADPDPLIIQNYNHIIEMASEKKYTHMKDGVPQRRTANQQMKESINLNEPFQALPLQIILRVLYNLTKLPSADTKHLVTVGVMLFQAMFMERKLRPSKGCFEELLCLAMAHPPTAKQAPSIMTIYYKNHSTVSPHMAATLDSLGLDHNGHAK